jgi:anaerobic C4-dicarboxylate transporter
MEILQTMFALIIVAAIGVLFWSLYKGIKANNKEISDNIKKQAALNNVINENCENIQETKKRRKKALKGFDWAFWICIAIVVILGIESGDLAETVLITFGLLFIRFVIPKMF